MTVARGVSFGVLSYSDYLKSEHWQRLRCRVRSQRKRRCELCQSKKNLETHHWRYRDSWFDSIPEDLILLCDACHRTVHRRGQNHLPIAELKAIYGDEYFNKPVPKVIRRGHPQDFWRQFVQRKRLKSRWSLVKTWSAKMGGIDNLFSQLGERGELLRAALKIPSPP